MNSPSVKQTVKQSPSDCTVEQRLLEAVVSAFNDEFSVLNTQLVGGAAEPFYQPAQGNQAARIHFRTDFLRSALHEVAHWCVAGRARLGLPDYGYWYSPDDRDAAQQRAFFTVEARPQAVERYFCQTVGVPFSPSVDNPGLQVSAADMRSFVARLDAASARYDARGWPLRAARFARCLSALEH